MTARGAGRIGMAATDLYPIEPLRQAMEMALGALMAVGFAFTISRRTSDFR